MGPAAQIGICGEPWLAARENRSAHAPTVRIHDRSREDLWARMRPIREAIAFRGANANDGA
jgi:hypothetical protein